PRRLRRVRCGSIAHPIAERAVPFGADRLVQRNRSLDRPQSLLDVDQIESRRLGELLDSRLLAGRSLQPHAGTGELDLALVHVRRDADRRRLVAHRTLTGLADPPGGVRRELVAAPPVELLDCPVQADDALLDQVAELHATALVAL